ncbi:MAG TPA: hypothetical protein VHM25_10625 [Polyangiaceae bacterium]|jgi:hypothetical protein|nr:hypothetical protein [Polyangiaceae bacterium]
MTSEPSPANPLLRGGVLALFAAIAFGVTTPLIQRFGEGAGPELVHEHVHGPDIHHQHEHE